MYKQTILPHDGKDKVIDFIIFDFNDDKIINDLASRSEMGCRKYGHYLETFNGRNAMQDAYEESLDLCMYLKQAIMEKTSIRKRFIYFLAKALCRLLSRMV